MARLDLARRNADSSRRRSRNGNVRAPCAFDAHSGRAWPWAHAPDQTCSPGIALVRPAKPLGCQRVASLEIVRIYFKVRMCLCLSGCWLPIRWQARTCRRRAIISSRFKNIPTIKSNTCMSRMRRKSNSLSTLMMSYSIIIARGCASRAMSARAIGIDCALFAGSRSSPCRTNMTALA
jgi:hypothetical protein